MNDHPQYERVKDVCNRYPEQAGALWQAYIDLTLAQRWEEVELLDLQDVNCCAIRGIRPKLADRTKQVVVPMHLQNQTNMNTLQSLFSHITPPVESIYLGISADDSSIVYYKISKGIVPPKEVKD